MIFLESGQFLLSNYREGGWGVAENRLKTAAPAKTCGAATNKKREIRANCKAPLQ